MKIDELRENWHKFGETDPLWAILSVPDRKGGRWDQEEFFATGRREVADLAAYVESLGFEFRGDAALDFGCGIGRITQPLCEYFDVCYGVDIAPSMITLAREYNQWGDRCRYILNETDDLSVFSDKSINFIYSVITFQNMAPQYARRYLEEFMRILDGLLIFQIPSEPLVLRQKIKQLLPASLMRLFYRLKYRGKPVMEMHGIKREKVIALLEAHQATVLDVQPDHRAFGEWSSFRYCVLKT